MIKRLFRWQHWRARARYWRLRCVKAEATLEAECHRNRSREDTLITVPVRMAGMVAVGLEPRMGPALQRRPAPLLNAANPWDAVKAIDRMEFETQWLPDALMHGVSETQARQQFMEELANRKRLNDDPYNN